MDTAEVRPDHAPALRAFDYSAAAVFGAAAGVVGRLATRALIPDLLPGILGMPVGMVTGVLAVLPLLGLFNALLGGFEILVMSMIVGMSAGMAGAMAGGPAGAQAATVGVIVGLAVQALLHLADRTLKGRVESVGAGGTGSGP